MFDIYAEITNRLIAEMEKGIIPWRKPWQAAGAAISHTSGKPYSLLNQMLLCRAGESSITMKPAATPSMASLWTLPSPRSAALRWSSMLKGIRTFKF